MIKGAGTLRPSERNSPISYNRWVPFFRQIHGFFVLT